MRLVDQLHLLHGGPGGHAQGGGEQLRSALSLLFLSLLASRSHSLKTPKTKYKIPAQRVQMKQPKTLVSELVAFLVSLTLKVGLIKCSTFFFFRSTVLIIKGVRESTRFLIKGSTFFYFDFRLDRNRVAENRRQYGKPRQQFTNKEI
jgi:hypothetical protein